MAHGHSTKDIPTLTRFSPSGADRHAAVLIIPGGCYSRIEVQREGIEAARWFSRNGFNAYVLRYRLAPDYAYPVPMIDADAAITKIRSDAARRGFSAKRVGIAGFSAGAHLAALIASRPDRRGPDFLVLGYPLLSLHGEYGRVPACRTALMGNADLEKELSMESRPIDKLPRTFVFYRQDDKKVPPLVTHEFVKRLQESHVDVAEVVRPTGGHGGGVAPDWSGELASWLAAPSGSADSEG